MLRYFQGTSACCSAEWFASRMLRFFRCGIEVARGEVGGCSGGYAVVAFIQVVALRESGVAHLFVVNMADVRDYQASRYIDQSCRMLLSLGNTSAGT
jgi:hypothetical protein